MEPRMRATTAGLDHCHVAGPVDLVIDANAAVEGEEIRVGADKRVLAVVDNFVDAGMEIGAGAAAEIRAALEEGDPQAGLGESAGGAHAGYAAADYRHGLDGPLRHAGEYVLLFNLTR